MKRSSLKRKTPLARGESELKRTPLPRARAGLKPSPLARRSEKRKKHMAEERVPLVKQLIADGVGCLICPLLVRAGIPTFPCSGIEGIHELRKSGDGGSRVNPKNLVPCCNWSNGWVEDFPDEAHKLGLVCREGDPDYESLSKRNDRFA